jgi:hypothetical protein
MKMKKRFIPIILTISILCILNATSMAEDKSSEGYIRRLTQSGNNLAKYPCLSSDGQRMLYTLEIKENEEETKAINILNIEDGTEKELFRDESQPVPSHFKEGTLRVGSKPPLLSGDGKVAVFSLSLDGPLKLQDHFLAVLPTDGSGFWMTSFSIQNLKGKDFESLEFESGNWERVANYAISEDGNRIACLVKGHLGPRRFGGSSGIIFLDMTTQEQTTLLAPEFKSDGWFWPEFPCRPATGGGWAFCMSEDGQTVIFGAQTSEDPNDYDLYTADWNSQEIVKITDFSDRWFSLADITQDGQSVLFFYNGKKKKGIGTYRIDKQGTDLAYIGSQTAPRIEFFDMSGNGRFVLFKNIYQGKRMNLQTGEEIVAFSHKTEGYVQGITPMDFPHYPSFWRPQIMSVSGERVLLVGPPQGKDSPEIYLLTIDTN